MLEISDISEPEDDEIITEFPIKSKIMSYQEFFYEHMVKNVPCLIKGLMSNWPAIKDFVNEENEEGELKIEKKDSIMYV